MPKSSKAKSRKPRRPKAPRSKAPTKPKRPTRKKAPPGFNAVRMGQRVGNIFGKSYGRLGAEAGRLFRHITGFGDYKVSKNSLMHGSDSLPAFGNTSAGTRVTHREFLFDVITSPLPGLFSIETVPIQPALLAAFPWLSASAENYQEYRLNGCVYEFKSNSYNALASTNTASGTVIMTTNYNVLDPPFTNKFTMEQSQFTCSDKPSNHIVHPIECSKLETPASILYTRSGQTGSGDMRLYDWGNFNIATVGMQGISTNIGELWVTYDITLLKPKLGATSDVADRYVALTPNLSAVKPGGPNYFGTLSLPMVQTTESDMGTTLSASVGVNLDSITWPPGYSGNVMVVIRWALASTASLTLATQYGYAITNSVAALRLFGLADPNGPTFDNEAINTILPMVYNGNGGCTLVSCFRITNGGTIRLVGGTTNGALTTADLIITALPISLGTGIIPTDPALMFNYPAIEVEEKKSLTHVSHGHEDNDSDVEFVINPTLRISTPIPRDGPKSSSNKSMKSLRSLP